ncbi:class I SAM-dependent methyltransferase [Sulfitobacter sp. F26204]|uniref:class I SAM-dependent methyltransferase n=1 Tax=Sulfitobacter sp. F26204 TaxID=2996014 RepID=UPI00225E0C46|nr:class I SAM-dependent methyltransferase [Sulfitobacter sp. F26204]MCX7560662.1 class I SAM-dependent methyltransferase [Sulfitobacter sp. F26204]
MDLRTMITFEQAMRVLDDDAITSLNISALDESDMVNLILQRSEIIRDQHRFNRYIKAWTQGDDAPMKELIDTMGVETLTRRAAAYIYLEYLQLRPIFEKKKPKKIADIGCGYALFDLFLAKDFDTDLVLIDLESNENRHFGFKSEGAAYSNLGTAKKLLTDNGIPAKAVKTVNPEKTDVATYKKLDYAFSFISCGYHFPWHTYRDFFLNSVADEGRIILDIRAHTLGDAMLELSEIGYVRAIVKAANNSADRIMVAKTL